MAVHASRVVTRRKFFEPGRVRRIVLASAASRLLVLACLSRLQQGNAKCAFAGRELLNLRCHRWKPPIGRIDNPRCPHARALDRREHRVVGTGHIGLGAALRTPVAGGDCSAQSVQLGSLRVGEKLLVRISCRALQRRVAFLGPYSLQIGLAPRCLGRCGGRYRRFSRPRCDRCSQANAECHWQGRTLSSSSRDSRA